MMPASFLSTSMPPIKKPPVFVAKTGGSQNPHYHAAVTLFSSTTRLSDLIGPVALRPQIALGLPFRSVGALQFNYLYNAIPPRQ
jgi:hypothetical protein